MGKKGGFWLFSAVKRAFKRGEKRSLKANNSEFVNKTNGHHVLNAQHRHALAVAKSTAAAAEAAAITAQAAAVEIIRLTRPSNLVREQLHAALLIQTVFRAYLARRALRALKGLVKLQAIVRGHNVRAQAKMMKKCMEAMDRVQARVNNRRSKFLHELTRKSMFVESNDFWEPKHLNRKSIDGLDNRLQKQEGTRDMAHYRNEKGIAYAFPNKNSRTGPNKSVGNESELTEDGTKWVNRWIPTKQWESNRVSRGQKNIMKTFEIDTLFRHYPYSAPNTHDRNRSQNPASPRTPHSSKSRQLRVRSDSPRCPKDGRRSFSATNTPNIGSTYCFTGAMCGARVSTSACPATAPVPNYMTATESATAKAKMRSQSTPRTRPSTPIERERCGSARKRLSYPAPEPHYDTAVGRSSIRHNSRSPSFKSIENESNNNNNNLYSYYTDSLGAGEIISLFHY